MNFKETFTLTFGDQAENHKGMEIIGEMSNKGFSLDNLLKAKEYFEEKGVTVEIYHLNKLTKEAKNVDDAYVLVARNGVDGILGKKGADKMYKEQDLLEKDTKAYMYGRVVNKNARYNLCFDKESREPNYEAGKGRIVGYDKVQNMFKFKKELNNVLSKKLVNNLVVEGNYYYNVDKCYIGFHGDAERRKVIGIRLGKSFKFHYQWYGLPEEDEDATRKAKAKNEKARVRKTKKLLGKRLEITLNHGDLYIMSEKAVGTDWMSQNVLTLRHAAGEVKNLKGINKKKTEGNECLYSPYKYLLNDEGYVVVELID
ncbi:MAG TPA: hypothetical protein PKD85_00275 [Saprospiraceae bacterium]|nr:hypothetical protein [Saprospiraceae bacterium]